jgi:hypothetical protein
MIIIPPYTSNMSCLTMQPGSSLFSDIGGWTLTSCKDPGLTDTHKNRIYIKNEKKLSLLTMPSNGAISMDHYTLTWN